jgi:hypothetical protein
VALNGGDFRRLVLQGVQPVHIANHGLDRGDNQRHPQRHGEHRANAGVLLPRSRCQAAEAPTNSALLRNAATDICSRR